MKQSFCYFKEKLKNKKRQGRKTFDTNKTILIADAAYETINERLKRIFLTF